MSFRFSSRLTGSPSFLCQSSKVASQTDSESCGTFTSTIICCSRSVFPRLRLSVHRVIEKPASNSPGTGIRGQGRNYSALRKLTANNYDPDSEFLLEFAECLFHQGLLPFVVARLEPSSGGGRR